MDESSAKKVMSAKSPVCVRIRSNKADHLELESEPVAVGWPKRRVAGTVSQNVKGKVKQSKRNAPPDVSLPMPHNP